MTSQIYKLVFAVLFPTLLIAKSKHREHEAHEHGNGSLEIAFDKNVAKLQFKIPSESIVGFEHKATKKKDKDKLNQEIMNFEKNISQMINFDEKLNCQFKKNKIEMISEKDDDHEENHDHESKHQHSSHSDFVVDYEINCQSSPLNSKLNIDFSQFKKIKNVKITILIDSIQKSEAYSGKTISIELK